MIGKQNETRCQLAINTNWNRHKHNRHVGPTAECKQANAFWPWCTGGGVRKDVFEVHKVEPTAWQQAFGGHTRQNGVISKCKCVSKWTLSVPRSGVHEEMNYSRHRSIIDECRHIIEMFALNWPLGGVELSGKGNGNERTCNDNRR